ncbi:hypothetical protein [Saccharopolyspora sp. NPDC050642]|uniref:hypothetical protein n=1 Tax=Saccharopolyspora sp. NPDC050642 TaxID=3157099 RepID=UPI0033EF7982
MSGYARPRRGEWITFHRHPVYGPHCHKACRAPGGHKGYAAVGQVAGLAEALFFGRRVYQVRYWHPRANGHPEALETQVPADRIIAIVAHPPDWKALVATEPSAASPRSTRIGRATAA